MDLKELVDLVSFQMPHSSIFRTSKRGKVPGIRASLFSKVGSINTLPVGLSSSLFRPRNSPSHQQPWEHVAGALRGAGPRAGPRAPLPAAPPPRPHVLAVLPSSPKEPGAESKEGSKAENAVTVPELGVRGGAGRAEGKGRAGLTVSLTVF